MLKQIALAASMTLLLVISCKKKEQKDPEPQTTTTTTSGTTTGGTTGGTTGSTTGPVITTTPTSYSGFLSCMVFTTSLAGYPTYAGSSGVAMFYSVATAYQNGPGIDAGTVRLNGSNLTFNNGLYNTVGLSVSQSQQLWEVSGANGIPGFTFANGINAPTAGNLEAIPSVISKSVGVNFTISNISDNKQGVFSITDGSSSTNGSVYQIVNGNSLAVNLSASQLSGLATGTAGNIVFQLENYQSANASGKDFRFSRQLLVMKSLTITP